MHQLTVPKPPTVLLKKQSARQDGATANAGTAEPHAVTVAVARLDAWLETMRGKMPGEAGASERSGYGGPVSHWWQQSLLYTGPGFDWRYEGIICGYLSLWERTNDQRWLDKARRAGDDLILSQTEDAHFPASTFEINPATAGTPHEAACDTALLRLALAVRALGGEAWKPYAAAAERNVRRFVVGQLWNPDVRAIGDQPWTPESHAFVPNKAATACEALFLLAEMTGDSRWVEEYALPTLAQIVEHQAHGGPLDGAIAQNTLGSRLVEKYFPIYNARCIPALLAGYRWSGDESLAAAASGAMEFIARSMQPDGSFPTVIYPSRRPNPGRTKASPSWIAPLGDVLRAADELAPLGFSADLSASLARLLAGQDESGGIQTARGFAHQAGATRQTLPDVRDVLHVVGWCDKAFRYLAAHAEPQMPPAMSARFEVDCTFGGERMTLVETPDSVTVSCQGQVGYLWHKSEVWPRIAAPAFWLR